MRPLTLLALAAISYTGLNALRKKHHERLGNTPKAKPESLQTWEGDGGGLPNGAPGQALSAMAPRRDDGTDPSVDTAARDATI